MRNAQSLPCLLLLLVGVQNVIAQDTDSKEESVELDPIVVVASKAPRPLSEVAGQVSVIRAGDISTHLVESFEDLFRYEPGLEAETSGTRFGSGGINIRGIGGNRVAMEVDGVPIRDGFAIGSYSNGGRDLLETDRIKRLEILHGPASALYGSDALGGVLAFTTWDPDDLTALGNGKTWLGLRSGYASADRSWQANAQGAWSNGRHGMLLSGSRREGNERSSAATGDAELDHQDWDSNNLAARYTLDTAGGSRWRFSAEHFERNTRTQMSSVLGKGRFRSTTALAGDDSDQRQQALVDVSFSTGWLDSAVARAYLSASETDQLTLEERGTATVPSRYRREFHLQNDLYGLEMNAFRKLQLASTDHNFGSGIDLLRTDVSEFRDGYQQNIASGDISHAILGEVMPVRDFPDSRTTELGIWLQDEIGFADGRWELIPALRYDRYELDPTADAIYVEDYPDTPVVSLSDSEVSPRLALMYSIDEDWSVYGQYVRGFRAPPVSDANIGFELSLFRYRALPNPDLESETSNGYELGLRRFVPGSRFSLTWFDTDYDDFIQSRVPIGHDPDSGYLLFQSQNIKRARIHGIDIRFDQNLGNWSEMLDNFSLTAAAYWARGENEDNGQPLNSVSPPQAIVGVAWRSEDGAWDAALTGTFTQAQDRIDETGGERFATPGYGLVDLVGGWQVNSAFSLRAGVFNLGDKTYWRWSDVSRLPASDPMIPLLARPGRNYSLSARFEW